MLLFLPFYLLPLLYNFVTGQSPIETQTFSPDLRSLSGRRSNYEPKFLVVAPSQVRPGQVYRVVVTLVSAEGPLELLATIQRDGTEVAGGKEAVSPGESKLILIQVPLQARPGDYRLQVHGSSNGVLGGGAFVHTSDLRFSEKFLTILIQTNQLVYNMLQTIRVRVVLLNTEMKPYTDPIDIYLLDSRGYVVKRWVSVYPFQGLVSVYFQLPGDFPKGWWKVRVVALQQREEKKILLERWFPDQFDVSVFLPAFAEIEDRVVAGYLTANYTNYLPVEANATITVSVKEPVTQFYPLTPNLGRRPYRPLVVKEMNFKYFKGKLDFEIETKELLKLSFPTTIVGKDIEFKATVIDPFYGTKIIGYGITRIINSTITLRFLDDQPAVFKPGMPFKTHLIVSYSDHVPLPPQKLLGSTLEVTTSLRAREEDLSFHDLRKLNVNSEGMAKLEIMVPDNVERFVLRARYRDSYTEVLAQLVAVSALSSEKRRFLHVATSTDLGVPGEYAIFHVRANFHMETFDYVVMSKGDILFTGTEAVKGLTRSVTTFAVALSMEMAPNCRVVVYHVTTDGELLSDRVDLPVQGIGRTKLSLGVNTRQERSGKLIEFVPSYGIGSIVGLSAMDETVYDVQGHNDVKLGTSTEALYKYVDESYKRTTIRNKHGMADKYLYYGQGNTGRDVEETFYFSGVSFVSNLRTATNLNSCSFLFRNNTQPSGSLFPPTISQQIISKNQNTGFSVFRCHNDDRCYPAYMRCNGIRDCNDGSDELNCWAVVDDSEQVLDFLIYRRNRNYFFYHSTGDDFAWEDTYTSYNVDNYVGINVPERPGTWILNAIGLTMAEGFSALDEDVTYYATRPFFATVEAPDVISVGEQVGIKIALFNYQDFEILVDVILEKSPDYCFVQVGDLGRVSSYRPSLVCATMQHLVFIPASETKLVHIPMVATLKGKIKVVILVRTQVAQEIKELEMEVLSEGALVPLHTSLLLDMRNQALLLKYLNVNVTDDPVIPYQYDRRFVYGSPEAEVTVIGDVVGTPGYDENNIVTFASLSIGKPAESGELFMFNFAYHYHTLDYLRKTSQVTNKQTKLWLQLLNKDYAHQIAYFKNGGFTMFGDERSVWLSAYCARIYYAAQFPEWDNYLYIDPKIIEDSLRYVFRHQYENGSFYEDGRSNSSFRYTPVALTSHVLITLARVKTVTGGIGTELALRKQTATRYLEQQLAHINSPFEMAIATFALLEAGSVAARIGFDKLDQMKLEMEEMIYWSPKNLSKVHLKYENQRAFVEPRLPERYDSEAVEATAYALLIYIRFEGLIQERIACWLNYIRLHSEGFVASYDTIVATESLIDYSFRTHIRSITDITMDIEFATHPHEPQQVKITKNNLAHQTKLVIPPPVYGHVTAIASGSGYGILQLDTRYRVDRDFLMLKPEVTAFQIDVLLTAGGRNKSSLHYSVCTRWLLYRDYPISDTAILEIDIPTGYYQNKQLIDEYIASRSVRNLKSGKVMPRIAVFMFDYLSYEPTCINFTVDRWFPVANGTRHMKAKVYDLNRPGLFVEKLLDMVVIHLLNICEVCGSYQCPYCPFYSSTMMCSPNILLIIFLLLLGFYKKFPPSIL